MPFNVAQILSEDSFLEPPACNDDDTFLECDNDDWLDGDAFERHITPPPSKDDDYINW